MSGRALLLLGLAAAVACGGPDARYDEAGNDRASETPEGALSDTVDVVLGEYFIDMPDTLPTGVRALRISNEGMHVHDLWIHLRGSDSILAYLETPLDPGAEGALPLSLEPGRYYANCRVANHEGRGMYHTFVVAPGPGGDG